MTALYRVDFPAAALGVELGPSRWDEVMSRPDAFAAIPAPAFGSAGPALLLRDASRKVQIASTEPGDGVVFCVDTSGTTARRGGSPTRGCTVAVQSLEPLVEGGAVVAPEAVDYAARTAIVLRRDGGLSFVATRGATSREMAQEIVDSVEGTWAAVTAVGDAAVLAMRDGVLLGAPESVESAWIVARRPALSQSRFVQAPRLPEMVSATRAAISLPASAAPGDSVDNPITPAALEHLRNGGRDVDILPLIAGVGLLAAAVWWYYRGKDN